MQTRVGFIVVLILITMSAVAVGSYTNALAVFGLGVGSRALSMGEAFVAVADDASALFYNAAGLAWLDGPTLLSSGAADLDGMAYGDVVGAFRRIGAGVVVFDFGEIIQTDESGKTLGVFSYRATALLVGAGIRGSSIPLIDQLELADSMALGLSVKLGRISTLDPGKGSGFSVDLPFLLRLDDPPFGGDVITQFSFGVSLLNLLAVPATYGSGHEEEWERTVSLGSSVQFLHHTLVALEARSSGSFRTGIEWTPVPQVSVRAGMRNEGVWIWSLGIGACVRQIEVDVTTVLHPYTGTTFKASLSLAW